MRQKWSDQGASPGEQLVPGVVISYSHDDRAVARRCAEGLEHVNFSVLRVQALTLGGALDRVTVDSPIDQG